MGFTEGKNCTNGGLTWHSQTHDSCLWLAYGSGVESTHGVVYKTKAILASCTHVGRALGDSRLVVTCLVLLTGCMSIQSHAEAVLALPPEMNRPCKGTRRIWPVFVFRLCCHARLMEECYDQVLVRTVCVVSSKYPVYNHICSPQKIHCGFLASSHVHVTLMRTASSM